MTSFLISFGIVHHIAHRAFFLGEVLLNLIIIPLSLWSRLFILSILIKRSNYVLHQLVLVVFHLFYSVTVQNLRILMFKLTLWNLFFLFADRRFCYWIIHLNERLELRGLLLSRNWDLLNCLLISNLTATGFTAFILPSFFSQLGLNFTDLTHHLLHLMNDSIGSSLFQAFIFINRLIDLMRFFK